ncbi:MAG: hypothetical protein MK110_02190 [Fuerstiella sp.]|nr:hypothetical protein [Fuerstiella sp.]
MTHSTQTDLSDQLHRGSGNSFVMLCGRPTDIGKWGIKREAWRSVRRRRSVSTDEDGR